MESTRFRERHSHIDVIPAFGNYILAVRDGSIPHQKEPEACYEINRVWTYVAAKLEDELELTNTLKEFFPIEHAALLVCSLDDKLIVDKVLARYVGTNPRRPVSKSA